MDKSYAKAGANVVTFATEQKNPSTDALVILEHAAHEVLDGNSFYVEYVDITMDDTNTIMILLVTPNTTKYAHAIVGCAGTKGLTLQFYEDTTTTDDGTALTEFNRNRNSSIAATVVATHTPTIGANGTLLQTRYAGSSGKYAEAGASRGLNEWILKANTKYLLKLTAHEDTMKARLYANWHEHTDIA